MSTLAYKLEYPDEYQDPNIVKVISDQNGNAIYFSRSPIPFFRTTPDEIPVLHHMGLYGFSREFLLKFTELPQSPLEKAESLEQLRAIENGYKIRVCKTAHRTLEINTPEELERAQAYSIDLTATLLSGS
jgi:3-deoxy-manno-octulosonate cytidylyltransferase (CMP-KDO synthetase)